MKLEYETWIKQNVPENPYGKCDEITKLMQKQFPNLVRAKGFYYDPILGRRTHWWLKDGEEIVDPTVAQFTIDEVELYEELSDEELEFRVPIGKCANCGEEIYKGGSHGSMICSDECSNEYIAYCKGI